MDPRASSFARRFVRSWVVMWTLSLVGFLLAGLHTTVTRESYAAEISDVAAALVWAGIISFIALGVVVVVPASLLAAALILPTGQVGALGLARVFLIGLAVLGALVVLGSTIMGLDWLVWVTFHDDLRCYDPCVLVG